VAPQEISRAAVVGAWLSLLANDDEFAVAERFLVGGPFVPLLCGAGDTAFASEEVDGMINSDEAVTSASDAAAARG
jgi:hypothetical protein